MASLVLGWRMPYLLSCFNVTGQSMLVPNEIALPGYGKRATLLQECPINF